MQVVEWEENKVTVALHQAMRELLAQNDEALHALAEASNLTSKVRSEMHRKQGIRTILQLLLAENIWTQLELTNDD